MPTTDEIRSKAEELVEEVGDPPSWLDLPASELSGDHWRTDEYRGYYERELRAAHTLAEYVSLDAAAIRSAHCPTETPAEWRTRADHLILMAALCADRRNTPDADRARQLLRGAMAGIPSGEEFYAPRHVELAASMLDLEYARAKGAAERPIDEVRDYLEWFAGRACATA